MRKALKRVAATLAACTMAFALAASVVPNTADASGVDCSKAGKKAGKAELDLDGTYHAYFVFQQTDSWVFRNTWFEKTLGLDGTELKGDATFDQMLTTLEVADAIPVGGTVVDAEIKGNGTYKVGVTGFDTSKLDPDAAKISLIGVSTDIPVSAVDDGTITFSDVRLDIDGTPKFDGEQPFENLDAKDWGLYQFDIVNTYQNEGYQSPNLLLPNDSVEITFTVSGFNSDNPDAVESTGEDTTAAGDSASGSTSSASSDGGSSTTAVVVVVIVVIIIAAVAVVIVKKKKS